MKELLNSRSVLTDLAAPAKCEVHGVNPIGMDDGKWLGALSGARTSVGGVVTKLEEVTGLTERRFLKVRAIPFLYPLTR